MFLGLKLVRCEEPRPEADPAAAKNAPAFVVSGRGGDVCGQDGAGAGDESRRGAESREGSTTRGHISGGEVTGEEGIGGVVGGEREHDGDYGDDDDNNDDDYAGGGGSSDGDQHSGHLNDDAVVNGSSLGSDFFDDGGAGGEDDDQAIDGNGGDDLSSAGDGLLFDDDDDDDDVFNFDMSEFELSLADASYPSMNDECEIWKHSWQYKVIIRG